MNSTEYRLLQEKRFGNNTGASFTEIIFVTQLPFILSFVALICSFKIANPYRKACLQCSLIFIPQILLLTRFSEYLYEFYTILSVIGFVLLLSLSIKINIRQKLNIVSKHVCIPDHRLTCVTNYRAIVNCFSILCILAADFECFPKKYLKTNIQGYGLMDVGVGMYVMSNALVNSHFTKIKDQKQIKVISFLWATFRKTSPLLIIGMGRFIATTIIQYHQSVSEYGVHWNFFITLWALALFNEILVLFVKEIRTVYTMITALSLLHECMLCIGLRSWVNSNSPRIGFISSNREGICSLLGYEVIYLCGLVIKSYLPKKGDNYKECIRVVYRFFVASIIFSLFTKVFENSVGVSRKLANGGYIFWIVCLSLISLADVILFEFFANVIYYDWPRQKKSIEQVTLIMKAINYNGLAFFLIGNLLTGFVNICIHTLMVNFYYSISIIILYMFLCCSIVVYLYQKNIRLR